LTKALKVKAHRISASAQEAIKKAGGSFELITLPGMQQKDIEKKNAKKAKKKKTSKK
jgi:ribosomal protein L18E